MQRTPFTEGYFQPAEWEPHDACWLAFPCDASLWEGNLASAQSEFVAMCRAIAGPDATDGIAERLEIFVPDDATRNLAAIQLRGVSCRFHLAPYGDIWMRDIAPIFVVNERGGKAAVRFRFNGWGEKYILAGDDKVGRRVATRADVESFTFPWVLEGGAVEVDGEGTCLTTRSCLLNPNRNPGRDVETIERDLRDALGVQRVVWLEEGLLNDHTDGHIDTIARFVAPSAVVCMEARDTDDPNRDVLDNIAKELADATDVNGRRLEVIRIPSPGRILGDDGHPMPATYCNFYISNTTVVVPVYESEWDDEAVQRIADLFPERRTVGISAKAILSGGGAFHCITQQQPRGPSDD